MLGGLGESIGGLGGGIAVLAGAGGRTGTREFKNAVAILERLKEDPGFDLSQIPPEQLKVFSEFFPEVYQAVVPEGVELGQDSAVGRAGQVRSLGLLGDMAQEGMPLQDRLATQEAGRAISGEMAGANRAIGRDLAERGRFSGGDAMALRAMSNQSAADLANRLGSSIAQQAMQRRMQAAGMAGQAAGNLRGQDFGNSAQNAEYANRFNEMRSGRQNEAAQYAAAVRNQAGAQRSDTRQRIGEANVTAAHDAQIRNQEYGNSMRQQIADNAYRKAVAQAEALQRLGAQRNDEKKMKDQQIMGVSKSGGSLGGGLLGGLL